MFRQGFPLAKLLTVGLIVPMVVLIAAESPTPTGVWAQPGPSESSTPKDEQRLEPLPAEIVKAWSDAGASVGWMRLHQSGYVEFIAKNAGKPGDLPAFRFSEWRAGVLDRLPPPAAGFGMSLLNIRVTDAGLKELAGLKNLQSLDLVGTRVTDAGLKELAGLKSLQTLYLNNTEVTDVGLKELAGLKSLRELYLHNTPVTDAGLKELAGMKSLQSLDLSYTLVTNAGIAELQKALPDCEIIR